MRALTARKAFLKSLPVLGGYLILGMGFGILAGRAGYGILWVLAMSLLMFAGSMQFVGIGLLQGGASVLITALTTVMVNARHLFYSISMIGRYKNTGRYKPYLIFALTDETYSLLSDGHAPEGENANLYRFLVRICSVSWSPCSIIPTGFWAALRAACWAASCPFPPSALNSP